VQHRQFDVAQAQPRNALACVGHHAAVAPQHAREQCRRGAPQADQRVAAIGGRAEHRVRLIERRRGLAQVSGVELRRVGADQQGARLRREHALKRVGHALAQITITLVADRDRMLLQCRRERCMVSIGRHAQLDRTDGRVDRLLQRGMHQAFSQLRRARFAERRNQPCLRIPRS
jgi:hypothetical protein